MWDGQVGNQHLDNTRCRHFVFPTVGKSPRIPFELVMNLPKPRYERNIVSRDGFGRIIHSKPPASLVFIDGLQKSEVKKVATGLRRIGVHTEKVRGLRDESDEFIRLMDAIAGLIRENEEGIEYAKKLYKLGLENKTLTTV